MDSMFAQMCEVNPELLEDEDPREGRNGEPPSNREASEILAKRMGAVPYVVWRQRDGMPIFVKDMDDHHLYCAIRMLERNADARAERENKKQLSTDPDTPFYELTREQCLGPTYHAMVKAAEARGIDLSEKSDKFMFVSHGDGMNLKNLGKRCCTCWAGRPGAVRMTTKLLEQRAKCPVHGGKKPSRR